MKTVTKLYNRGFSAILCVVVFCLAVSGCGQRTPENVKIEPHAGTAAIEIVNGGADECQVSIDGRQKETVAPFKVLRFAVAPGRHIVKVFRGGQEEENIPVELKPGMVGVCNPGARSDFVRIELDYDENGARKVSMPAGVHVRKERLIITDLGLLDKVPEQYSKPNQTAGQVNLAKLYRIQLEKMSAAEAVAVLDGELQIHFGVGHTTTRDFFMKAVESLNMAEATNVQRVLSRILDQPAEAPWINTPAVDAMLRCMAGKGVMPDDKRLREWVMADLKEHSYMARAIQSAKLLLEGTNADSVVRELAGLPFRNQASILIASRSINKPALVRQIVMEGLKSAAPEVEIELLQLISFGRMTVDEALARHVESRITSMKDDSPDIKARRLSLERAWMGRLTREGDNLAGDWAVGSLSRLLQHEDKTISLSALRALLSRGESRRVAEMYASLSAIMRRSALDCLSDVCGDKKKASEDDVMLLGAAMKDDEISHRLAACKISAELFRAHKLPGILAIMKQAKAVEPDPETAKKMDAFIQYAEAGMQ
jgi:hypothetical protein